mgnify:CR=1 FL=1
MSAFQQVLEVVKQKQHLLGTQVLQQLLPRFYLGGEGEIQRMGDGGDEGRYNGVHCTDAAECDPVDAIYKHICHRRSRSEGQVRLAAAAGSDQAQQATGRLQEVLLNGG